MFIHLFNVKNYFQTTFAKLPLEKLTDQTVKRIGLAAIALIGLALFAYCLRRCLKKVNVTRIKESCTDQILSVVGTPAARRYLSRRGKTEAPPKSDEPVTKSEPVTTSPVSPKSFDAYLKEANEGKLEAQLHVAKIYKDENPQRALHYYKLAADQNDANAIYAYASFCDIQEMEDEALANYMKAGIKGHPEAQYLLGCMYESDENMQEDALKWYTKAAEQNHVLAIAKVAYFKEKSLGTK